MTYKQDFNKKFNQPLNKSNSLENIQKLTGIKIKVLKDIFKRGVGAFRTNPTSVRKSVKTEEQWAYARIYSSLMNYYHWKKTGNEKGAFKYDRDIFEKYNNL